MSAPRTDDLLTVSHLVRDGHARTRGEIGKSLSLRSSTVSELVGELVERDLLRESATPPRGRGRPATSLSYNHQRLGSVLVSVIDRTLVAEVVDLAGRVLAQRTVSPPAEADNATMGECIRRLVDDALTDSPSGIEICTVVFALSGLLDRTRSLWCFTSRWPRLRDLDLPATLPSREREVEIVRNLDAELAGIRLHERHPPEESALLLHWGQGIGAAFSVDDVIVNRNRGRFCEIGHWGLGDALGRVCTCGSTDCLETVAALWALGPRLREHFPDLPLEESALGEHMRRIDPLRSTAMSEALAQVLRLTTNLCRLLFPDRVVLSGPFVQNPEVFGRFVQALERAPLLKSLDRIRVSANEMDRRFEITGALHEPFEAALRRLLETGSHRRSAETP